MTRKHPNSPPANHGSTQVHGGDTPAAVLPRQPGPNDPAWNGWLHPDDWHEPAFDRGARERQAIEEMRRDAGYSLTLGREDPPGEGWGPVAVIFACAFMLTLLFAAIGWNVVQTRMAESAATVLDK